MSELLGPQQVVLITTRALIEQFGKEIERDDIETVYWHMPVSKEEMLYAIAVHNNKNIVNMIKISGVFIVNFMSFDMDKKAHQCDLIHGEHIDKFEELGLIKDNTTSIECPRIKEACAYMECHVKQTLDFADHTVFIAKIINSRVVYGVKRLFHLKDNNYTTTKD